MNRASVAPVLRLTQQWRGKFLFGRPLAEARRTVAATTLTARITVAEDDDLHGCLEDEREICARAERDGRL